MSMTRMKLEGETGVYHCVTRTVAGAMLLDGRAKEVLRKMLWQVAEFSGVEILAYCIMTNHFHVLVRVPEAEGLSVEEIVRRFRILYPEEGVHAMPDPRVLEAILRDEGSDEAVRWRNRLCRRMHDVSEFMKTLKQRFSVWYNQNHKRFGTLWAERFRSAIVEDAPTALRTVAAYIDLNPVRAGLVQDPADYRWSSFGEATGGEAASQLGLAMVMGSDCWDQAAADYRIVLYGKGAVGRAGEQGAIPLEQAREVLSRQGEVDEARMLHYRIRYLTQGAILGSEAFVRRVGARFSPRSAVAKGKKQLGRLPAAGSVGSLCSWRRLRD